MSHRRDNDARAAAERRRRRRRLLADRRRPLPTFDRSCGETVDCEIAFHMVDCCGTRHALGISRSELARFDAAEARGEAMYPACGSGSSG